MNLLLIFTFILQWSKYIMNLNQLILFLRKSEEKKYVRIWPMDQNFGWSSESHSLEHTGKSRLNNLRLLENNFLALEQKYEL